MIIPHQILAIPVQRLLLLLRFLGVAFIIFARTFVGPLFGVQMEDEVEDEDEV